eukprot:544491_1
MTANMDTKSMDLSYSDNSTDSDKNPGANEYKSFEGPSTVVVKLQSPSEKVEKKQEESETPKKEKKTKEPLKLPRIKLYKADKYFSMMLAMYILIGILAFMIVEEFTFVNSFYFRVVTLFKVGFGDITPTTNSGKILNAILMVVDMCTFLYVYWRIFYILFINDNNKFIKNKYYIISCIIGILLLFLCGTLVFSYGEGHDFVDAFVWNFVTISSVGYGDIIPSSPSCKIFCIFYI